jgi:hypothetical protein
MNDLFEIIFALTLLIAVIFVFFWLALRFKRSGRSPATIMYGALYETYDKDKRAAIEHVIEQNVKKMEEQENEKPLEPPDNRSS